MNVMFKEIRHGDIEKIRTRIENDPDVVNEVYTGKKPLKDIGQSPLQVAIKCGEFEIIDLLLDNGANPDFMENRADAPEDTEDHYFMSMSVLHDAIMGTFNSLYYSQVDRSENFVKVIARLLELGANPNKETDPHPVLNETSLPMDTLVVEAAGVLNQFGRRQTEQEIKIYDVAKQRLLEILDLLKKYGVDFDLWLDREFYDGNTNRWAYLDDFIPVEDQSYEMEIHGKMISGVDKGDEDPRKEIRAALQEYFNTK